MNNTTTRTKTKTLAIVIVLVAAAAVITGIYPVTIQQASAAVKCKAIGDSDLICQNIDQQATIDQQQTVNGDGSSATATGTITQSASNTATISR